MNQRMANKITVIHKNKSLAFRKKVVLKKLVFKNPETWLKPAFQTTKPFKTEFFLESRPVS
jgi:hypothetical protein